MGDFHHLPDSFGIVTISAFSLILNASMIQPLVILEVIIQYNTTFTHVIIGSFYYDLITMTLKQWRELQFKTIFTKSVIYILV